MSEGFIIVPGSFRRPRVERTPQKVAHRHSLVSNEEINCIFSYFFGASSITIMPVNTGMGAAVYIVETPDGVNRILKFDVFGNHHLEHEAILCSRLHTAYPVLPVPQISVLDLSLQHSEFAFLIEERLPGEPLWYALKATSKQRTASAFHQIGSALACIHKLGPPPIGYGRLDERWYLLHPPVQWLTAPLRGEYLTCCEYYKEWCVASQINFLVSNSYLSISQAAGVSEALSTYEYARMTPANLHGDPTPKNFLFRNDVLSGIVDLNSRLAPIEEDLARVQMFTTELSIPFPSVDSRTAWEFFLKGYGMNENGLTESPAFYSVSIRIALKRVVTLLKHDELLRARCTIQWLLGLLDEWKEVTSVRHP